MQNQTPLIFNINRHALDDGPGIRTVIFFKGCPLECVWCHNPESISHMKEIGFYSSECIQRKNKNAKPLDICIECARSCPMEAIKMDDEGYVTGIDRTICNRCGLCVDACPGRALRDIGHYYEVGELLDIILSDHIYYQTSRGGVTLSGGEPTMYMKYASLLLGELKKCGIHTAIETCGLFDYSKFKTKLLKHLDLILFDIKLWNSSLHEQYTSTKVKDNLLIRRNLRMLTKEKPDAVIPRIPLVPGITADRDNLKRIALFFNTLEIKKCWLLPYNPTWSYKLDVIDKKPAVELPKRRLTEEEMSDIRGVFSDYEIKVMTTYEDNA